MLEQPQAAWLLVGWLTGDRLAETGGEALVDRPYPWLIRRGLVQRQACSDRRCDGGIRLDTGGECGNCNNVIHIRRARRAKMIAAGTGSGSGRPRVPPGWHATCGSRPGGL
ncbi:hypothetical protein [Streptomyces canus]|uniref:hypothetical protein n=1 Tax=Streptomyces canus TaxID=58343 RepID=UPI003250FD48